MTRGWDRLTRSQSRARWSAPPVIAVCPFSLKAMAFTEPVWPTSAVRRYGWWGSARSHRIAAPSRPPVRAARPSGVNPTMTTVPACPQQYHRIVKLVRVGDVPEQSGAKVVSGQDAAPIWAERDRGQLRRVGRVSHE